MYISIRDEVAYGAGYPTLEAGLNDLGISGIELFALRDNSVPSISGAKGTRLNLATTDGMRELKSQVERSGARVCALCLGNNFNAADREEELAWVERMVRAAHTLGAPVVRIDAIMSGERDLPLERRIELFSTAVQDVLSRTEDTGVDLGIENHGYQGNDPEFLNALLKSVGSARLGLTLDSGNFYWRGWPLSRVYEIFREFAPVVKHTHAKNIAYPEGLQERQREIGYEYGKYVSPIQDGDIDHAAYISLLKEAGYDRDICLEDESLGRYPLQERKDNLQGAVKLFASLISP